MEKCGEGNCQMCGHVIKGPTFRSTETGDRYKIMNRTFGCKSACVVYLITCKKPGCRGQQFVGQTGPPMNQHLGHIRSSAEDLALGKLEGAEGHIRHFVSHFSPEEHRQRGSEGKSFIEHLSLQIIDKCSTREEALEHEAFWQHLLRPALDVDQEGQLAKYKDLVSTKKYHKKIMKNYEWLGTDKYDEDDGRQRKFDSALVDFIVKDLHPFSVISGSGFQTLMESVDSRLNIKDKRAFAEHEVDRIFLDKKDNLFEIWDSHIKKVPAVAFTSDEWFSFKKVAHLAIRCHYVGEDFRLRTWVSDCIDHDEEMADPRKNSLLSRLPPNIELVFVTDSSHMLCISHVLQGAIDDAYSKCPVIEAAKDRALENVAGVADENTHWCLQFKSFTELETNWAPSREDRKKIKALAHVLQLLKDAGQKLSADDAPTSHKVFLLLSRLVGQLSKVTSAYGKNFAEKLADTIQEHISRLRPAQFQYFAAASLLDVRFKDLHFTEDFQVFLSEDYLEQTKKFLMEQMMKAPQIDRGTSTEDLPVDSDEEDFAQSIREKNRSEEMLRRTEIQKELQTYLGLSRPAQQVDVLAWWGNRKADLPYLAQQARRFMAFPAMCGACKILFKDNDVIRRRETTYLPGVIERIIFLHENKSKIEKEHL